MKHEKALVLPGRLTHVLPGAVPVPVPVEVPASAAAQAAERQQREAIERVLAGFQEAVKSLRLQQQQSLDSIQQVAVELAVTIASKIVHESIQAGDFGVESLVRTVIERLQPRGPVAVHLHPDDLALLEQRLGDQHPLFAVERDIRFVGDASLRRGDCKAQAGELCVLADLQGQLADIRRHLFQVEPVRKTG